MLTLELVTAYQDCEMDILENEHSCSDLEDDLLVNHLKGYKYFATIYTS